MKRMLLLVSFILLQQCCQAVTVKPTTPDAPEITTTMLFGYVKTKQENITIPTLVIDVCKVAPFIMVKKECDFGRNTLAECEGNSKYEGFNIDLLNRLSARMGFEYEIVERSNIGVQNEDGTWTGIIGDLVAGKADLGMAPITINQERQKVIDFTHPFMTTGISIMMKKPDKMKEDVFSFFKPFTIETWIAIGVSYIVVSLVVFFVSQQTHVRSNGPISHDITILTCFWFPLKGIDSRSIAARIASCIWWIFALVVICCYTASLAAYLSNQKTVTRAPIQSIDDLVKQSTIKYGVQSGGSTASFFKNAKIDVYNRAWINMEQQEPSVFVKSYFEGIQKVRESKGNYAFILESTANEYENAKKPCDTIKVGDNLNSISYGLALPQGSKWIDKMSDIILNLDENGELKKLRNRWWVDRSQCGFTEAKQIGEETPSLSLSQMSTIFYVLLAGMFIAFVFAIAEHLYHSRRDEEQAKAIHSLEKIELNEELMMDEELAGEESIIDEQINEQQQMMGLDYPAEV